MGTGRAWYDAEHKHTRSLHSTRDAHAVYCARHDARTHQNRSQPPVDAAAAERMFC